jgi:predicted enzyme related to lactoylglutathione lyase
MGRPVVRFEVMGDDGNRLRAFYGNLFAWKIDVFDDYGLVDGNANEDGAGISGGIGAAPGVPGHLTFYVEVPDVEGTLSQAERLGGTRVMGPTQVQPGVELGMIHDPEGHLVGLIKAQDA